MLRILQFIKYKMEKYEKANAKYFLEIKNKVKIYLF